MWGQIHEEDTPDYSARQFLQYDPDQFRATLPPLSQGGCATFGYRRERKNYQVLNNALLCSALNRLSRSFKLSPK